MPNPEDPLESPQFGSGPNLFRIAPSPGSSHAQWSPAVSASTTAASSRRPRRFFDAGNTDGSTTRAKQQDQPLWSKDEFLSSFPAGPAPNNNNNGQRSDKKSSNDAETTGKTMIDGIDVEQLRSLTKKSFGTDAASPLPTTAVFYASLLYSKTGSRDDCFLYAQALARNGESKRCVRLLEQSGMLEHPGTNPSLYLESVLLAADALSVLVEWQGVLELLEDACHMGTGAENNNDSYKYAHSFPLDDEDDLAWENFFRLVEQPEGYIHPVSRLCLWRGRAYAETGHPQRAAVYWKRALQMDPKCVQALDLLLARSVVTPREAFDVIQSLNFEESMEWLRNLYLARIDVTVEGTQFENADASFQAPPQTDTDMQTGGMTPKTPFAIGEQSHYLDASSIQLSSPFMMNTPGVNDMSTTSNLRTVHFNYSNADEGHPVGQDDQKLPAKSSIQVCVDDAFAKLWHVHKLDQSPAVLAMAARRAYRRYDLKSALGHCQQLAAIDPLCQEAGYVYIATLSALGHKRHLFKLAHEWVAASPKSARAWFAVGSYYYCCERFHVAQRHFCRATRLDPHCTEAWIAFGCSFAACDESDQALASFRAAQRISPGEYASLLYMGMEYLRTNHLVLAQYFLNAACKASGGDPLCLNELGVLSMHRSDYPGAIEWFSRALIACVYSSSDGEAQKSVFDCIHLCQEKHWEATIFNLGQCFRKTRRFSEASQCFERCIALSPEKCSGYAALGFTKHLMGNLDEAIDSYHQALGCKPEDPFSTEMLNKALQESLSSTFISEDDTGMPNSMVSNTPFRFGHSSVGMEQSVLGKESGGANMMSDDGANLSAESDVDMSLASMASS